MQTDRAFGCPPGLRFFAELWNNWHQRRTRLVEFDKFDAGEMQRMARDFGTSVLELRILAGHREDAAKMLGRRLQSLNINSDTIEPAVMRDLQRCCSQCGAKALCQHELEDRPKAASWPKYCPNEQTIDALLSERKAARSCAIVTV